jgi:transposase-like protein
MSHHGGSTFNMHKRKQETGPLRFANMSMMNFVTRESGGRINLPPLGALDDEDDMRMGGDDDNGDDNGRPIVVPGGQQTPPKVRKGTPYGPRVTPADKLKAVEMSKLLGPAEAGRRLGLSPATIFGWRKKAEETECAGVQNAPPGAAPTPADLAHALEDQRATKSGRRLNGEVFDALYAFFLAMRAVRPVLFIQTDSTHRLFNRKAWASIAK